MAGVAAGHGRLGARALLRASPLFRDLPRDTLDHIVELGYTRQMQVGEVLYLQGDPGDGLYLILTGAVRISALGPEGQALHLNTLSAGDVMGEIALLDGGSRSATASATEAGALFCIDRADFLELVARQPAARGWCQHRERKAQCFDRRRIARE